MSGKALTAGSVLLVLILSESSGQEADRSEISVYNPGKGWSSGNGRLQKNGQHLSSGSDLNGTPNLTDSELVLQCKDKMLFYRCEKEQCKVRACEDKADGVSVVELPFTTLPKRDSYFLRQPQALVTLAARAGGNVMDAVLLQKGGDVHWAPAFKRVLEGRYCIRLRALPASGSASARSFTLDWDRSVDTEGIVSLPGLQPGTYAVEKGTPQSDGACAFDTDAYPAWVLIVPESDFERVDARWKESAAHFRQLEMAGVGQTALVTFRQAVLADLADSLGK